MDVDDFAAKIKKIVLARVEQDRLPLPAMPKVAHTCLKMIAEPDTGLVEVANALEGDPVLVAHVLKLANSAALGGAVTVDSVQQAASRVGMEKLKAMLVQFSARQVFKSTNKKINALFHEIWEHSVAVAILARDLATLHGEVDADHAYQAGLLHDVGKPIVGIMLLEAERSVLASSGGRLKAWLSDEDWIKIVNAQHRPVAKALTEAWELPEQVKKAVQECGDYDSAERQSVTNVVRYANALAKKLELYPGVIDADQVESMLMVGGSLVGLSEDMADKASNDIASKVQQMVA